MVADPLQKADAIVVFGGQLPFRAMEAAALYRQDWAPEVWVTQSDSWEDRASAKLGIDYAPEHEFSRRVLEKLGVPPGAIHMLELAVNTTGEVWATVTRLRATGGRPDLRAGHGRTGEDRGPGEEPDPAVRAEAG